MSERLMYVTNDNFEYQEDIPIMHGHYIGQGSVVIPDTERFSNTFDFSFFKSLSLYIPVGFAGTSITFYAAIEDTEDELIMKECFDGEAVPVAITLTVVADSYVCPDPALLKGLLNMRFLKLRSDLVQNADREITIFAIA